MHQMLEKSAPADYKLPKTGEELRFRRRLLRRLICAASTRLIASVAPRYPPSTSARMASTPQVIRGIFRSASMARIGSRSERLGLFRTGVSRCGCKASAGGAQPHSANAIWSATEAKPSASNSIALEPSQARSDDSTAGQPTTSEGACRSGHTERRRKIIVRSIAHHMQHVDARCLLPSAVQSGCTGIGARDGSWSAEPAL